MSSRPYDLIRCKDDDEWLRCRRMGVGGSDVAAIMGLSPWRSPYQVWADKVIGIRDDISGRPAVEWGTILEPVVGDHYKALHPDRTVRRVNAVCRSHARPWAQASLDYEVRDPDAGWGVLEIKTASLRAAESWEDGVPLWYQTQVTHYLSVTGRPYADVAVLIGGQDYREYRITRDEDDIAAVNAAVDAFWHDNVEGEVAPDVGGSSGELPSLAHGTLRGLREKVTGEKDTYDPVYNKAQELIYEKTGYPSADGRNVILSSQLQDKDSPLMRLAERVLDTTGAGRALFNAQSPASIAVTTETAKERRKARLGMPFEYEEIEAMREVSEELADAMQAENDKYGQNNPAADVYKKPKITAAQLTLAKGAEKRRLLRELYQVP